MTYPKPEHLVPPMTVDAATDYAQFIHADIASRARSDDELDWAYDQFERQHGVGRWTIEHLRKKKAKGCDIGVFARLQMAYLDICERKAARLANVIAIEKAKGDDTNSDIAAELEAILAKVRARKARLTARPAVDGGEL